MQEHSHSDYCLANIILRIRLIFIRKGVCIRAQFKWPINNVELIPETQRRFI